MITIFKELEGQDSTNFAAPDPEASSPLIQTDHHPIIGQSAAAISRRLSSAATVLSPMAAVSDIESHMPRPPSVGRKKSKVTQVF